MTYIEFFEKTASENVCASLMQPPDRVILIGDKAKLMQKHAQRYRAVLAARGFNVEFVCKAVNKNNMQSILDALCAIIESDRDCVFDLTGGEDLYLVAMGILFERYRDRNIQMIRFNLRNHTVLDCDEGGRLVSEPAPPKLTVEENIRIFGGDIVYADTKSEATFRWDWSEDFQRDIDAMWEVCRQNVRLWNTQSNVLAAMDACAEKSPDGLTVTAAMPCLTDRLETLGGKYIFVRRIFDELLHAGLLTSYDCDSYAVTITYKNAQVKRCLTKAGQALEMKIYSAARQATESDGTSTYNDVMNGVYIDWDGDIHTAQHSCDTENEIDVMMMNGMVPVFVSCKNGRVDIDELYKLDAVANRFGGKYAKKVLVATALGGHSTFAEYFRQRAKDMQIRLVEGVQELSGEELQRVVRSFWQN